MLEKQKTQPNFGNAGAINNLIRAAIAKAATRPSRPDGKIQLEVSSTIHLFDYTVSFFLKEYVKSGYHHTQTYRPSKPPGHFLLSTNGKHSLQSIFRKGIFFSP